MSTKTFGRVSFLRYNGIEKHQMFTYLFKDFHGEICFEGSFLNYYGIDQCQMSTKTFLEIISFKVSFLRYYGTEKHQMLPTSSKTFRGRSASKSPS